MGMTDQAAFDQAVRGVIKQGRPSASGYFSLFISGYAESDLEHPDDRFDGTRPAPTSLGLDTRLLIAKLVRTLVPGLKREQIAI